MATAEFSPLDIIGTILKILSQLFFRWTSLEPFKKYFRSCFSIFIFVFVVGPPNLPGRTKLAPLGNNSTFSRGASH